MPSSWSASLRFELQFTGENINLWGDKLNVVLNHADYAIAGWLTKPLTGNYTLATANAGDDEARAAMIKFTGAGPFTVTIPSVSKAYDLWNACSAPLTMTTGAGATAVLQPGERLRVLCDGIGVYRQQVTDFAGGRLTSVGDPAAPQDVATKAYVDGQAFGAMSGTFPGQVGSAGKPLVTNGTTAFWGGGVFIQSATSASLQMVESDQATLLGGLKSDSSGHVDLINAGGAPRLRTNADGTGSLFADSGGSAAILTATNYAAASDVRAGTSTTKVSTPAATMDSAAFQTLADAATVTWDVSLGYNAKLTLTANAHTIGNPINLADGEVVVLLINPSTFTLSGWASKWNFGSAAAPTIPALAWSKVTGQYDATRDKIDAVFWRGA